MLLADIVVLLFSFWILARVVEVFFIETLEIISKKLKLSSDIAGATFMAVGSSAPELFVSAFALIRPSVGEQAVGAGTIVGSAIFNILVIVGASALFRRAVLTWQPVIRDLLFYILTILLLLFTFVDGEITLFDSALFVSVYGVYIASFSFWKKLFPYTVDKKFADDVIEDAEKKQSHIEDAPFTFGNSIDRVLSYVFFDLRKKPHLAMANFAIAITILAVSSHFMVDAAVHIAQFFGIAEVIIGLTILAAGTSVPDLLSSVAVAKKGRGDMAVANAVGSNTFDINVGLGLPWMLFILFTGRSIPVVTENLSSSIVLLFATVIALLFLLIVKKWEIGRYAGVLLIAGYIFYLLTQAGILDVTVCINAWGRACFAL